MAYAIGVDFGTLSARAVVADLRTGDIVGESVKDYPHAVLESALPDGTPLPSDFALAVPKDYLDALTETVSAAVRASGVSVEEIIGIGLDVTSSTFLPVNENGQPLCEDPKYARNPHAWMKLWKHHAAACYAERMTDTAKERGERFLARCGGRIQAEWMLPKLAEIFNRAPEIAQNAADFMEAGDWLVRMLTGANTRNRCAAGYKLLENEELSEDYLDSILPGFAAFLQTHLGGERIANGTRAGGLTEAMAERMGLCTGIAVAAANVDAHVAAPAAGIDGAGKLLMILGTSCCAMLCAEEEREVPGIFGMVRDGILPGYVGYEAGQSCVGDLYEWCVKNTPEDCTHETLTERAAALKPGESGLIALDWFNGNRSCLADADLTGLILGLTLRTKPHEIYRALIEATAFGMRVIIDTLKQAGVPVNTLYACGGIVRKNPLLMQIYSDITGREIFTAVSTQTPALGSAMHGAVAAGYFADIIDAARKIGRVSEKTYKPNTENRAVYEELYREYVRLHDTFGRGENNVMKKLKVLKTKAEHR